MTTKGQDFNEDDLYDLFPTGADDGYGPEEGYNTFVQVNDKSLFTDEALKNPAIRAFVEAPISVTYAQFKSSYRESEYFIHKPHLAMTGNVDGIVGEVDGVSSDDPRTPIGTYVINHEQTLAFHITRTVVLSDGETAGQIILKQPPPPPQG
jgi:hypothetical protein